MADARSRVPGRRRVPAWASRRGRHAARQGNTAVGIEIR